MQRLLLRGNRGSRARLGATRGPPQDPCQACWCWRAAWPFGAATPAVWPAWPRGRRGTCLETRCSRAALCRSPMEEAGGASVSVLSLRPLWAWRWVGGWCHLEGGGRPGPLCWRPAGPWVLMPQNRVGEICLGGPVSSSLASRPVREGVGVPSERVCRWCRTASRHCGGHTSVGVPQAS